MRQGPLAPRFRLVGPSEAFRPVRPRRTPGRHDPEVRSVLTPPESGQAPDLLDDLGSPALRRILDPPRGPGPLTVVQGQVLEQVTRRPRIPMSEVARALGVTLPAVTHVVKRLERQGLVARQGDPGDRRTCLVAPTPEGGALAMERRARRTEAFRAVLARMSPGDRQRLARGIRALLRATAG